VARIGIIGGTGLYALEGLANIREFKVETPFGAPSDALVAGELGDNQVVFLSRHGRGHRLTPSEVPYRANVFALKSLGVEWLVSVSAVGSLAEEVHPGAIVLPDQYIDRTHGRARSFFGNGLVGHVSLADPNCGSLRSIIAGAAASLDFKVHQGGTYLCIEGPAFSTRAESNLYRSWGAQIIGMTSMPEVTLAREAELHYATLALVTDYDCWKTNEEAVSADSVIATLQRNVANVRRILAALVPALGKARLPQGACNCSNALGAAMLTDPACVPPEQRETLGPLLMKYGK
jgi:5'-methylthioadenosine phosphorylase